MIVRLSSRDIRAHRFVLAARSDNWGVSTLAEVDNLGEELDGLLDHPCHGYVGNTLDMLAILLSCFGNTLNLDMIAILTI